MPHLSSPIPNTSPMLVSIPTASPNKYTVSIMPHLVISSSIIPHLQINAIQNASPVRSPIPNTSLMLVSIPTASLNVVRYLKYLPHSQTVQNTSLFVHDSIIHIISPCIIDDPKYLTLLQCTISTTSRVSYLCSIIL
jgi:hypothetical protein